MKPTDLIQENLRTIARLIREREVSPVEVAKAHLKQIARLNPELNAIVTIAPDVIERARAAEAAVLRGVSLGALHGVPLTIKDTIETAGIRTTSGSKMRVDYVPQTDAPAVARLKAAGAIILGKSNAAEMAMDYTADNPVFGRTNHPLNRDLTPGGSSGGEAVAIATHMSPGGLGSDLAGSVRIPAHFCGICGLKPTTGRVPGELQFPPSIGPYSLGVELGNDLWLKLFSRASVVQLRGVYKGRESEGGSFVSWRLGTADDTPAPALDEYIAYWMERDRLREELVQWMESTPIIIAPVGATPAYPHDTLKVTTNHRTFGTFKAFSYAQTFSVFNLPVVTIPAGKSAEGLPIGVQIAGGPFTEELILAAAEVVEAALSTTGGDSDI